MNINYINQISIALQALMVFSYKAHLKSSNGFEIEDERNGYESEQFAEDIQSDCGIQFLRATTSRYGADYELHYKMVGWLAELINSHNLPLTFTSSAVNTNGTDQIYITSVNAINNEVAYETAILDELDDKDYLQIIEKLNSQLTYLTLKY
jgi:hypothetical protein